jgi:hypothetical protein
MTPTQQALLNLAQFLLAGGIGAAIVKLIDNVVQHKMDRADKEKEQAKDDVKEKVERLESKVEDLRALTEATVASQKYLLLDKIQFLGRKYIADEVVDFDDRRRLREMHDVYHKALGGNGDLDIIMAAVDELPLKEATK